MARTEVLDALSEFGVVVEESVRDARFALNGLESDRIVSFDEATDRVLGVSGLVLRLGFRCCVEHGDPPISDVVHG